MDGMRLFGFEDNETVRHQVSRGKGEKVPHESSPFTEENRISLDVTYMFDTPEGTSIHRKEIDELVPRVLEAHRMLDREEGDIRDGDIPMTGWKDLPDKLDGRHLQEIKSVTKRLSGEIDAFVSLGIGGSYLGVEATFKALTHTYFNQLSREERGGRLRSISWARTWIPTTSGTPWTCWRASEWESTSSPNPALLRRPPLPSGSWSNS
jgi:hypothetical protein